MGFRVPSDDPLSGKDPNTEAFFMVTRRDDPDAAERLARHEATVRDRMGRDRMGEEAFGRWKRSRAFLENPRPLGDQESRVLRETLAPLLRDLAATGQTLPDIREEAHEDRGEDSVCAWIQLAGGGGEGISVELYCDEPSRLYYLARQLQSWKNDELIDAGRRPWPECPDHPDPCALIPDEHDEVTVWRCPQTGRVVAEIGSLGLP